MNKKKLMMHWKQKMTIFFGTLFFCKCDNYYGTEGVAFILHAIIINRGECGLIETLKSQIRHCTTYMHCNQINDSWEACKKGLYRIVTVINCRTIIRSPSILNDHSRSYLLIKKQSETS